MRSSRPSSIPRPPAFRRRGGVTVRGGPRRHLPRLQGAGIAGGGRRCAKAIFPARRGRDEADAPARQQPARGDLRGRLRDLRRGARRQAAAGNGVTTRLSRRHPGGTGHMNPFESMQALGRSLGQGCPGDGLRLSAGHEGGGRRDEQGLRRLVRCPTTRRLEEARRAFEQSWSAAQDLSSSLTRGTAGRRWVRRLRSDRRGHAGEDPRSARLDVGDERGRRGAPAHGGRATPCRSVERGASVRRGVQRPGSGCVSAASSTTRSCSTPGRGRPAPSPSA